MQKSFLSLMSLSLCPPEEKYKTEVIEQIKSNYPGAEYLPERNFFLYKGIEFGYLKTSIGFNGAIGDFNLVDKESRTWIYIFGDPEERFRDFLVARNKRIEVDNKISDMLKRNNLPIYKRFIEDFKGLIKKYI